MENFNPKVDNGSIKYAENVLFLDLMVNIHCTAYQTDVVSILFHSSVYSVVLNTLQSYISIEQFGVMVVSGFIQFKHWT